MLLMCRHLALSLMCHCQAALGFLVWNHSLCSNQPRHWCMGYTTYPSQSCTAANSSHRTPGLGLTAAHAVRKYQTAYHVCGKLTGLHVPQATQAAVVPVAASSVASWLPKTRRPKTRRQLRQKAVRAQVLAQARAQAQAHAAIPCGAAGLPSSSRPAVAAWAALVCPLLRPFWSPCWSEVGCPDYSQGDCLYPFSATLLQLEPCCWHS